MVKYVNWSLFSIFSRDLSTVYYEALQKNTDNFIFSLYIYLTKMWMKDDDDMASMKDAPFSLLENLLSDRTWPALGFII